MFLIFTQKNHSEVQISCDKIFCFVFYIYPHYVTLLIDFFFCVNFKKSKSEKLLILPMIMMIISVFKFLIDNKYFLLIIIDAYSGFNRCHCTMVCRGFDIMSCQCFVSDAPDPFLPV